MSRNGSGTQSSPAGSFPAVGGTLIESTKFNNVINDINASLTASIANDGQTPILANLPMSGFKHTGAAAATASGQYVEYAQMNAALAGKANSGANSDITSLSAFNSTLSVSTATSPAHALRFDQYKNRMTLVSAATGSGSPADTAENNLKSADTVAGVLSANGDMLHFVNKYRCAANATTKQIKIYFGSAVLANSGAIAHNGSNIIVEGWIIRTGATTQVAYTKIIEGTTGAAWNSSLTGNVNFSTAAETLANAITLRTTVTLGAGAALNDVIQDSMYYEIIKV